MKLSKLFEEVLTEATIQVSSDVDLLYNLYFKEFIDYLNQTGQVDKRLIKVSETDSSILKCEQSIKSNEVNPITIYINHSSQVTSRNYYYPTSKLISLSFNFDVVDLIYDSGNIDMAVQEIPTNRINNFKSELTEYRIKGSIHHELAHWINDSLYNSHIDTMLKKKNDLINRGIKKTTRNHIHNIPRNDGNIEIEGQIHNIVQLYRKFKDVWNELTFMDIMDFLPSLNTVYKNLTPELRSEWIKNLKKRMYREGLLGNNMMNENTDKDTIKLVSKSDKGNRYFQMLKTAKFQHYDSPNGELSTFNKGEEDRKRLVNKLSKEDKITYRLWLKTKEGQKSIELFNNYLN
jgi:hypothetical protein